MSQKQIESLQKGLEILSCFNREDAAMPAKTVAERVGLPQSTIYRYLDTLVDSGFLVRSERDKHYRLGFMLVQLGENAARSMDFVDHVIPHMAQLLRDLDETILLTVRSGWKAVCLAKKETQQLIKLSLEVGTTLPLYAGAASKTLLAFQDPSFIDRYLKRARFEPFTPYTSVSADRIREELETIRREGYCYADQEVNLGATAVSAPIFQNGLKIMGSLTAAGPSERIRAKRDLVVETLKREAAQASRSIGCRSVA